MRRGSASGVEPARMRPYRGLRRLSGPLGPRSAAGSGFGLTEIRRRSNISRAGRAHLGNVGLKEMIAIDLASEQPLSVNALKY
jgi:hypothetical protein